MRLPTFIETKRAAILAAAARHGAGHVRVFGSQVRGDARADSDVDILIDVVGPTTPWFPGGLVLDLESLLGKRVDVVTERGLNRLLKDRVLQEAVPL